MKFNLGNDFDVARLRARVDYLVNKKTPNVELVEKRTVRQNNYLHLILGWFAVETGNTIQFVKEEYYKRLVNPSIFVIEKTDKFLGKVQVLKSSSLLTTAEMTLSIERFRDWSSMEAGIYLPSPDEEAFLAHVQEELNRQKQWI